MRIINVYTDGSFDKISDKGAWGTIICYDDQEIILADIVSGTTHNRMELQAVIQSLRYIIDYQLNASIIRIYTDSQYVSGLLAKRQRLENKNFTNRKGKILPNADLLQEFYTTIDQLNTKVELIKVKAHMKKDEAEYPYNRKIDMYVRKMVRGSKLH